MWMGDPGPGSLTPDPSPFAPTVVGDVGHLEAAAAIALIGLELDPELARAGGEGDGPLIGLAGLIGGDGCGRGWGRRHVGPLCRPQPSGTHPAHFPTSNPAPPLL